MIFVKMGLGSGQQHFGKSNKTVLILIPDYLFTSHFESFFFLMQIKGIGIFWECEKKKKKTIPAPEDQRVDPLAILCQDIEKVVCEHPTRHDPETNQHTYLCHKIGPWKS